MAKRTSMYRKLTRRKRTLSGYTQLWIAEDHLLLLKSTRFTEEYKRFALADIQAITVTELPDRTVLQVILAVAALAWIAALFAVTSLFAKGFFAVTGGFALALVMIDIARGPRCRCYLHTAVSREPLVPVCRMKIAQKFLAQIQPLIESVQGALPRDQVSPPESTGWKIGDAAGPPPTESARAPGYVPEVLFGLFLLDAAIILAAVRFRQPEISGILPSTIFTEIVLVLVAFLRRAGRDARMIIYVVMGLAVVGIGVDLYNILLIYGAWFVDLQAAAQQKKTLPLPAVFTTLQMTTWIAAGWRMAAGVIGLAAAFYERRSVKTQ